MNFLSLISVISKIYRDIGILVKKFFYNPIQKIKRILPLISVIADSLASSFNPSFAVINDLPRPN